MGIDLGGQPAGRTDDDTYGNGPLIVQLSHLFQVFCVQFLQQLLEDMSVHYRVVCANTVCFMHGACPD